MLVIAIPFACRATGAGPRRPPPPASIQVTLPADVTMWVQDLVHWDNAVYGLLHHFGDPRLSGLWRVDVQTGEFAILRFTAGAAECRLPINYFDIGPAGLQALFFCPPGCAPELCETGEVRQGEEVLMPFRGAVEGEWHPAVHRGPAGTIEGWRYSIEALDQGEGAAPGRFVLMRTDRPVRGRN